MFGVISSVILPQSGGVYKTYEDLAKDLNNRMEKEGYKIVKARSHRNRGAADNIPENRIVRCDLVCDRGGRPYKCMATKHKTSTKKTNCPWSAKAVFRKAIQGWILTILCDQHNHEPGTPEPPTPSEGSVVDEEEDADEEEEGPRPDADTLAAMQVSGVSPAVLRLTGETFSQFKTEYRKLSQPELIGVLSQLQLRIAAIYAVQNEEVQREKRAETQRKRHAEIAEGRRQAGLPMNPPKRRRGVPQAQAQAEAQTQAPGQQAQGQRAEASATTGQQQSQQQGQHQAQHHHPPPPHQMPARHSTEMIFPVPGFDTVEQFSSFQETDSQGNIRRPQYGANQPRGT
jgi:hypothetical protein